MAWFDLSEFDDQPTDPGYPPPRPVPTVPDGLYCCGPCGEVTLESHLRGRGWDGDIRAELGALLQQGRAFYHDDTVSFPQHPVRLFTIRGQK